MFYFLFLRVKELKGESNGNDENQDVEESEHSLDEIEHTEQDLLIDSEHPPDNLISDELDHLVISQMETVQLNEIELDSPDAKDGYDPDSDMIPTISTITPPIKSIKTSMSSKTTAKSSILSHLNAATSKDRNFKQIVTHSVSPSHLNITPALPNSLSTVTSTGSNVPAARESSSSLPSPSSIDAGYSHILINAHRS